MDGEIGIQDHLLVSSERSIHQFCRGDVLGCRNMILTEILLTSQIYETVIGFP
jgi:hypothetical protein